MEPQGRIADSARTEHAQAPDSTQQPMPQPSRWKHHRNFMCAEDAEERHARLLA